MIKRIIITIILGLLLSVTVYAETGELYKEQYEKSGAADLISALPDNTREYFENNRIDPSDYDWVNSLTAQTVFGHIWEFLKSGAAAPLKAGGAILAIILISAALSSLELKGGAADAAIYAASAASAATVILPSVSVIGVTVSLLKGISTFMLSFIPVFAVTVAASGSAITSAAMSGLLLAAAEGVGFISGFIIAPIMNGYLCLSVSEALSAGLKKIALGDTIKKLAFWIMALISTVFVGILSIQTAVNSSADTLTSKTARFIIGSAVPVAGGVLSEAMNTVTASMGILKSSVGIYGAVALIIMLLPVISELAVWRLMLNLTYAVGELFSLPKISLLLRSVDSVMSVLLGILLLVGAMFIISLSVVISGVR